MSGMTQIADLLGEVISAAPDDKRNELAQALEDYAAKYSRSYDSAMSNKVPMLTTLLDVIVENTDARIRHKL